MLVAFNATAATAPILGVLAGGWFIDFVGGYKNERGMMKTLIILDFWAMLCLFFGICACFVANFIAIICFIWCILFFGGGILPAATGIVIASVPLEVRAFGSGFCMMIYNVFGYVIGTLVPGAIIQAAGLTWGMRVSQRKILPTWVASSPGRSSGVCTFRRVCLWSPSTCEDVPLVKDRVVHLLVVLS